MRKQTKQDEWVVAEPPREPWFERGFDFGMGVLSAFLVLFFLVPVAALMLAALIAWLLRVVS